MKSRKITKSEQKRVISYCEYVALFVASIFINIKLAVVLLFASPIIIPILVGIKEKNFHFFKEENNKIKDIVNTKFCA